MKKYLLSLLKATGVNFSITSKGNTSQMNTKNHEVDPVDPALMISLVHDFFQAFDNRDIKKMEGILTSTTKTIHHNGVETSTSEMMEIVSNTKNWYPRERRLTKFECISDTKIAIVGFFNEVTFSLPEDRKIYEPYKETWVFEKIENSWHPTRIHYSKIIQDEHSEEVE